MSYDIWLEIDTGNGQTAEVGPDMNYTSNVSPMWRKALEGTGFNGLAAMDGRRASDCEPALRTAVAAMDTDFEAYEAMSPHNKWGDAAGARSVLWALADWCEKHPNTTVRVHR
jgi:hypothetical protein